jgi:translation elongation factor EF-G
MGDINKRRGRIMGTDAEGETSIITAEVPLAEITEYTMELRSLTRGSGSSYPNSWRTKKYRLRSWIKLSPMRKKNNLA